MHYTIHQHKLHRVGVRVMNAGCWLQQTAHPWRAPQPARRWRYTINHLGYWLALKIGQPLCEWARNPQHCAQCTLRKVA